MIPGTQLLVSTRISPKLVESVPDLVYAPRKLGTSPPSGSLASCNNPHSHFSVFAVFRHGGGTVPFAKASLTLFRSFKSPYLQYVPVFCKSFKCGRSRTWEKGGRRPTNGAADDRRGLATWQLSSRCFRSGTTTLEFALSGGRWGRPPCA